jgi:hypothetical protein
MRGGRSTHDWLTLSPYYPDHLRAVGGDMLARNIHAKDGATTAYILWAKHRAASRAP